METVDLIPLLHYKCNHSFISIFNVFLHTYTLTTRLLKLLFIPYHYCYYYISFIQLSPMYSNEHIYLYILLLLLLPKTLLYSNVYFTQQQFFLHNTITIMNYPNQSSTTTTTMIISRIVTALPLIETRILKMVLRCFKLFNVIFWTL